MKDIISYFERVTTVTPALAVSLVYIFDLIRGDELKELTMKIRKDISLKLLLPCVTFAGLFLKRCKEGLTEWSSLVSIDIDHIALAPVWKEKLKRDCFLNPVLVYITPSGEGLRLVVRVEGSKAENYKLYYDLISFYLQGAYGIPADDACTDVSRLSFICHDPEPYFFEDGLVTEEALLRLQPKMEEMKKKQEKVNETLAASVSARYVDALREHRKSSVRNLPPASFSSNSKPSELNKLPAVHQLAETALRNNGWKQKGKRWTRPGKDDGTSSAVFDFFEREGIFVMTNFSSNSPGFGRKGYSDVGILTELVYQGDFKKCISELAHRFLDKN